MTHYLTVSKNISVGGYITSSYQQYLKATTMKLTNMASATSIGINIKGISFGADVTMISKSILVYQISRHLAQ